jgi:hypothetical protein
MLGIDHRFALSKPAFVSAFSKKSFSKVNSPILACSTVTSTLGVDVASPKPVLPLRNLVGMHIEVLRKLGKGLVTLQCSQCHLRFKSRGVVPAWTSAHLLSSFRHFRRLGNRTSTYPVVRISETGS